MDAVPESRLNVQSVIFGEPKSPVGIDILNCNGRTPMAVAEDNDLGSIVVAVVVATVVFGSLLYFLDDADDVQTASDLTPFEKTVPTIVPTAPRILGIPSRAKS
jgi:hypothetical protein